MNKKNLIALLAFAGMLSMAASLRAQTYNVVMTCAEQPTATNTSVSGTTVETFNSLTQGDYTNFDSAIGNYSSISIRNANQYGGAAGPGFASGSSYAVASTSANLGGIPSYTLTFNTPVAYFGLWWSAGDAANNLTFYSGSTQVAAFTTQNLVNKLTDKSYFGNPTPGHLGQDGNERFAFLNFYGLEGTLFTSVVFGNSGSSGFENDNNTIRQVAYGSDPSDNPSGVLPGVPIEEVLNKDGVQTILTATNDIAIHANIDLSAQLVPEPGTNALLAMAGIAGLALVARRRSAKA